VELAHLLHGGRYPVSPQANAVFVDAAAGSGLVQSIGSVVEGTEIVSLLKADELGGLSAGGDEEEKKEKGSHPFIGTWSRLRRSTRPPPSSTWTKMR
jgi:hypothetical protein